MWNDLDVRVLFAVIDGERTVRGVARRVDRCPSVALTRLRRLRNAGLIDWVPCRSGTLHALVREVR
jgi:predicted transcriptional regulator